MNIEINRRLEHYYRENYCECTLLLLATVNANCRCEQIKIGAQRRIRKRSIIIFIVNREIEKFSIIEKIGKLCFVPVTLRKCGVCIIHFYFK